MAVLSRKPPAKATSRDQNVAPLTGIFNSRFVGQPEVIQKRACGKCERTLQLSTTRKYGRPHTMNPNSFCFSQVRFRFVSVGFVCEKCAKSARLHSRVSGRCPADCRSVENATRTTLRNLLGASCVLTQIKSRFACLSSATVCSGVATGENATISEDCCILASRFFCEPGTL